MRVLYIFISIFIGVSVWPPVWAEGGNLSASPSVAVTAQQQLIDTLNARYQSTVAQCAEDRPAYYCSGIMLRTTTYNAAYPFWTHSPGAAQLGSLTFSYIRRDVGSNGSDLGSGFIFSTQEAALAQNKATVVRCIYPFMAGTQGAGRPGFGCGFAATTNVKQGGDLSTCATLSTPATTSALWLANFRFYGSSAQKQCSLSTTVASQFKASLEAHNAVSTAHTMTRNELLIGTWRPEAPELLPIEAFFYNAATGGLLNVHALRRAYYLKTSQRLPVVRVNFSAADRNIFSWREADQVDGWEVADRLNARYNNTAYDCAGKAAFYCNGVIVRTTTYGANFHSWNPSPTSRTDMSFSYLRKDMKMTHVFAEGIVEQGYIFKEANTYGQQGVYPLIVRCSFPYDAGTSERNNEGCGASSSYPNASRSCAELGITTIDKWRKHFSPYPSIVHAITISAGSMLIRKVLHSA